MRYATLILSGGKSSRMGQDKGSLSLNGRLWVEIVRDEVLPLGDVFLSVGEHNKHLYSSINNVQFIPDQPLENLAGPLKGLLSSKQELQAYDKVLIVPCDMIELKTLDLKRLIESKTTSCYQINDRLFPLPFSISKNDLQQLTHVENRSLSSVLKSLNLEVFLSEDLNRFNNYNSKADIIG